MVWVGGEFDQTLLLKAIDQDLNVLTRAESGASNLRHRLRAVALEKLKRGSAGAREC
jgi:hypothetical protein